MTHYRKNEPAVASETIDGEVIAINLDQGTYYSLQGIAAELWGMVEQGMPVDAMTRSVELAYVPAERPIGEVVGDFLKQLEDEELIVSAGAAEQASQDMPGAPDTKGSRLAMPMPILNKYADMQDLLLLDPIHEVDASGWPSQKTE